MKLFMFVVLLVVIPLSFARAQLGINNNNALPDDPFEAHVMPDVECIVPNLEEATQVPGEFLLNSKEYGNVPVRDMDTTKLREGQRLRCVLVEIKTELYFTACTLYVPRLQKNA